MLRRHLKFRHRTIHDTEERISNNVLAFHPVKFGQRFVVGFLRLSDDGSALAGQLIGRETCKSIAI
jgi:hypothetical protein